VIVRVLVERGYDRRVFFFYYRDRRGRNVVSHFGGAGSSWVVSWVVALLSAGSFATFSRKVSWFTAVEAFILLLVVCAFFFRELGSETSFSGAGKIYPRVFHGSSSHTRASRALRRSRALAWSFPELVLLVKEAGFID
jgi:hypothetical protein